MKKTFFFVLFVVLFLAGLVFYLYRNSIKTSYSKTSTSVKEEISDVKENLGETFWDIKEDLDDWLSDIKQ